MKKLKWYRITEIEKRRVTYHVQATSKPDAQRRFDNDEAELIDSDDDHSLIVTDGPYIDLIPEGEQQ